MIDVFAFNQALKISWIRRLLNSENEKWVNLLEAPWPEYYKFVVFGTDFIKQNVKKKPKDFLARCVWSCL